MKDDLVATLEQLVIHKDRFDYILIETTGLANPGPVVAALWTDKQLGSSLILDGVVCVVDSLNISHYLSSADIADDVKTQICFADRVLLNKSDLVNEDQVWRVLSVQCCVKLEINILNILQMMANEELIKGINSFAIVKSTCYSKIDLDFVLNTNSYIADTLDNELIQCLPCSSSVATTSIPKSLFPSLQKNSQLAATASGTHNLSAMSTEYLRISKTFDLRKLSAMLDSLLYNNGDDVSEQIHDSRSGRTKSYTKGAFVESGSISGGMKVYRMKGVIHIAENDVLHVLQAVHNIFDIQPSPYNKNSEQDTTKGDSLIVIIGRNLNKEFLEMKFCECCI